MPAPDSAHKTTRCSACCASPSRRRFSKGPYACSSCSPPSSGYPLCCHKLARPLDRPPGQRLTDPLGYDDPIVRQLARRFTVGFDGLTVIKIVPVDLHLVVRIDLGGDDLGLLLV